MPMTANYTEPEELLADESFLSWYFKSDAKGQEEWDRWMAGHPEREQLVRQAVALLESVQLPDKEVPEQQVQAAEAALLRKIDAMPPRKLDETSAQKPGEKSQRKPDEMLVQKPDASTSSPRGASSSPGGVRPLYSFRRWMVAAVLLLLLGAGVELISLRSTHREIVQTEYGQLVNRELPDGSEVTVDANSRLRYSAGWKEGASREVWISGEAFFHVRRTAANSRFIVHTDHLDIIVTGTRFNVVNRNGVENVLLKEGSVTLRDASGKEVVMRPGEFVSFRKTILEKRKVQPDSVTAWTDRRLVFDKTPLRELVTIVNDHYGVHLQLENAALGDSTISAILPNDNLDVLLQALEATSEFAIRRSDHEITIAARGDHN
jgi:ferric-dicitrate binding protein FerR (iron transport regulator)